MTHLSEDCRRLAVEYVVADSSESIRQLQKNFDDVCVVVLPLPPPPGGKSSDGRTVDKIVDVVLEKLGPNATLITVGEPADLVHAHSRATGSLHHQLWIAIERNSPKLSPDNTALPQHHFGAFVHTKYSGTLKHTKTRIKYTYCPACEKTTKDYGGKKHTYNSYGTLISDVWRDISADLEGDLSSIVDRFADLFGIPGYEQLLVLDIRAGEGANAVAETSPKYISQATFFQPIQQTVPNGRLIHGDVLEELRNLDDESVDFAFADPPYNLKKKYNSYADDMSITAYFAWCDEWVSELIRILRPGRTCAILNIPLWSVRHFLHLQGIVRFQNWIAWDALSFPVRRIMPAHYSILCFSKGSSRPLPGLVDPQEEFSIPNSAITFQPLEPLAEGYCLRSRCIRSRKLMAMNDRGPLTDLWRDIHRLKHNSRRVDHPCQLPPQLMYRLISTFTGPGETILDCFDGAGTTTLAAHQMGRQYIGIELSEKYHKIAESRHSEILQGTDPFRKVKRKLTEKNSPVERLREQAYKVSKKTLQLEIRRIAQELNRLPTREEVIRFAKYPIEYYDNYFVSWGEVCAAARHQGMSEERDPSSTPEEDFGQLSLF